MTTNLSLITNTAKTDTYIFLIHGLCNRTCNGSLTGSRRAYKTEDRTPTLMCKLTHCKEFHNTFFYIFQSVMSFLKDSPRILKILGILGFFIPRKCKNCFKISSLYRCLCRTCCHSLETADLLGYLLFYFIGSLEFFQLFAEFLNVISCIILAKLLSYRLKLLTENVFSLILVDMGFHLALEIFCNMNHFNLTAKKCTQDLIAVIERDSLKELLFILIGHREIHCNLIDGLLHILNDHDLVYQISAYFATLSAVFLEKFPDTTEHGIFYRFRISLFLCCDNLAFSFQVWFFLLQA